MLIIETFAGKSIYGKVLFGILEDVGSSLLYPLFLLIPMIAFSA